ncbi:MAG: hypothetical protein J6032_04460, partial [Bacteroidales bacterium]|nr:hypothetical protein [Bacteroidales bacterium]
SIAYDSNNREPLFYETYPGSIVDISQLQMMLDKAVAYGYKNADYSGIPAHLGRSSAQPDRTSAHLT